MRELQIVSYANYSVPQIATIGRRLVLTFGKDGGRLADDFPNVVRRYLGDQDGCRRAIGCTVSRIGLDYNAAFVLLNGVEIGVVSYATNQQSRLQAIRDRLRGRLPIPGTLIAGWLIPADQRPGQARGILPDVMKIGAELMRNMAENAEGSRLARDPAWTLVRRENWSSTQALALDRDANGFGRFARWSYGRFDHVDGVASPRLLMACKDWRLGR